MGLRIASRRRVPRVVGVRFSCPSCPRRGGGPGEDRFELDRVLPPVPEVILVEQLVTGLGKHLVKAYILLGDPWIAFLDLEGAQVVLGLGAVAPGAGAELVQVAVGPAERDLNNLVHLIQEKVRGQLKPAPQWWLVP